MIPANKLLTDNTRVKEAVTIREGGMVAPRHVVLSTHGVARVAEVGVRTVFAKETLYGAARELLTSRCQVSSVTKGCTRWRRPAMYRGRSSRAVACCEG